MIHRAWHLAGLAAALAVFAAVPAAAATLFGLVSTGELYRSTDNGAAWSALATLPVRDAVALSARFSTSDLFLATRSGGVYRSIDAGANWSAVGAIAAGDIADMAVRSDGTLLALAASGSVYGSADLGVTFTPLAAITAPNMVSLTCTTPLAGYALARTGEVYASPDGGATWAPAGAIATSSARRVRALGASLYVLTDEGDVYRSDDAAANWAPVGSLSQVGMRGLVRSAGALVAATVEGDVASSADGATWTWQGSINQLALTALASDEPVSTSVGPGSIDGVAFSGPRPNPSHGAATFAVTLAREGDVTLSLYDLSGRRVAVRATERLGPGTHAIAWAPPVQGAGLYFARMESPAGSIGRRWLIVR